MRNDYNIDKLVEVDNSGMPKAPNVRQLLDKDILQLYARDITTDKRNYIKECGVIYYLGDPKSPAMQQGLSRNEAIKLAIENFDLPKNYYPDALVLRITERYFAQCITEAGRTIKSLRESMHLMNLHSSRINEFLNDKLKTAVTGEEISSILNYIKDVRDMIKDIPAMTKALATAYENLQDEEEQQIARGGVMVYSSMNADEA